MGLFSFFSNNRSSGDEKGIPAAILSAVSVMGDGEKPSEPAISRPADTPSPAAVPPLPSAVIPKPAVAGKQIPSGGQIANPFLEDAPASVNIGTKSIQSEPDIVLPGTHQSDFTGDELQMNPSFPGTYSQRGSVVSKHTDIRPEITFSSSAEKTGGSHWIWVGIVSLVLVVGVGAAYYFFVVRQPVAVPVQPSVQTAVPVAVMPPPILPYATDAPNDLMFDIENVTAAGIRQALAEAADKIAAAGITQPVEFLITDQKNNPIAFSRFAFLSGISLSPDLLAALDTDFSIFVFNDNGKARYGLSLSQKSDTLGDLIRKEETALPAEFQPLLYGDPIKRKTPFASSNDGDQAIRYVMIDEAQALSFDYSLKGARWLIGTSKQMFRAMLAKVQ